MLLSCHILFHCVVVLQDLRQDMNTQTRKPKTGSPDTARTEVAVTTPLITRHSTPSGMHDYGRCDKCTVTITTATLTAQKMAATTTPSLPHNQGQAPLTSSTRLSALNMVGDLLRKVGVSGVIYFVMVSHDDT